MVDLGSSLRIAFFTLLFTATAALAQSPQPSADPGPVPPALPNARTVFVSNAGADAGLFPEPFSGDPNRAYSEFYADLKASGRFDLATNPAQADLVFELRLTAPYGPTNANKQNGAADPRPEFHLAVYDRASHYILWSESQSIDVAFLQKTHDRNFDDALNAIVNRILQIAGHTRPM
jgi:hypothetical protein